MIYCKKMKFNLNNHYTIELLYRGSYFLITDIHYIVYEFTSLVTQYAILYNYYSIILNEFLTKFH